MISQKNGAVTTTDDISSDLDVARVFPICLWALKRRVIDATHRPKPSCGKSSIEVPPGVWSHLGDADIIGSQDSKDIV